MTYHIKSPQYPFLFPLNFCGHSRFIIVVKVRGAEPSSHNQRKAWLLTMITRTESKALYRNSSIQSSLIPIPNPKLPKWNLDQSQCTRRQIGSRTQFEPARLRIYIGRVLVEHPWDNKELWELHLCVKPVYGD